MRKSILFLLALTASLRAGDFHISPTGDGAKDGSSRGNAAPGAAASSIFNESMKPGDRMLLAPGVYDGMSLLLTSGGTASLPKIIEGSGDVVLSSDWTVMRPDKGATAISFGPGASRITIRNLGIRNYCFSLRAGESKDKPRADLILENIRMEQMRHGIYFSDCDRMTIKDCVMKRYSKHGFRFEQGCDDVLLENCVADCSEGDLEWETRTELFPFGFTVNDGGEPNTRFTFKGCVARNNMKSNQGSRKYTNGDGFVVEGNAREVEFIRCKALRNQDGGFDLKVREVKLADCVATGNRRDYRIWYTGTMTNCFGGWSQCGLWTEGGPVSVSRCTFFSHQQCAVEADEKSTVGITLEHCLLAAGGEAPKLGVVLGKTNLTDSKILKQGEDAGFVNPDQKWSGEGDAMDSLTYPHKGYCSKSL